jgi:DNA polymerase III gamma/tau subunit
MKKLQWITSLSLVAVLLGSCTSNSTVSKAPTPKPSVSSAPVAANPPAPKPAEKVAPVPGLIPPTEPISIPIPKGRRDPFGSVAVAPIKQQSPSETTKPSQTRQEPSKQSITKPNNTKPDNTKTQAKTTSNQKATTASKQTTSNQKATTASKQTTSNQKATTASKQTTSNQKVATASKQTTSNQKVATASKQTTSNQKVATASKQTTSNQKVATTDKPSSPQRNVTSQPLNPPSAPAPSTELASAVEIKGVMQVGRKLSAIVKESDGKASRYVSAGEYIANGAVLVKRIQVADNQQPLVILEQNGVEVIKPVSNTIGSVASIQ